MTHYKVQDAKVENLFESTLLDIGNLFISKEPRMGGQDQDFGEEGVYHSYKTQTCL